ncbi:MAG: hypothetical protein ACLFVO_04295 [Chloroflexaceae bacterium]
MAVQADWADLRRLPKPPRGLLERMRTSVDLYPCDLLFVHRDAEGEPYLSRRQEIVRVLEEAVQLPPTVCVIPVRMQEAWLLFDEPAIRTTAGNPNSNGVGCLLGLVGFDEPAIRTAAGNPNGRDRLDLPRLQHVEGLPDPKEVLYELLRTASGLSGRRRKKLPVSRLAQRVADFIDDFAPLRTLPAFTALEDAIRETVEIHGWTGP